MTAGQNVMPSYSSLIEIADPDVFASGRADAVFRFLRSAHPVHYHPNHRFGPYWSLTRYADVLDAELRPQDFSSSDGITDVDWDPSFALEMFIASDGPLHKELRSAAAPLISGDVVARVRGEMEDEVDRILTSLPVGDPIDGVSDLATPIARAVGRRLFSSTEAAIADLEKLTAVAHGTGPFVELSVRERMKLLRAQAGKVASGGLWDLARKLGKGPLGVLGNAIFLASASLETMRAAVAASLVAQHQHHEQVSLIYENEKYLPAFISEVLRWHPPLAYMRRTTTKDLTLRNMLIPKGSKVLLWYASANRDEDVFDLPNRIAMDRKGPCRSLSFGAGPHHCLGRRLAEMVMDILWSNITSRGYRIIVTSSPRRMRSYFVHGFESIPAIINRQQ